MKGLDWLQGHSKKRKALGLALYTFFVVLLAVGGLELGLRSGAVKMKYAIKANNEIELDHEYLYRIVPKSSDEINNMGYRDPLNFTTQRSRKKRIAFLGDSFIYGIDVPSEKTVPKELERMLGEDYEVYNMGVYGYGPDQSLMQLRDEVLSLKPDLVILSIFAGNDFNDIIKNRLFTLNESGGLVYNPQNIVSSEIGTLRLPYLARYLKYRQSGSKESDKELKDLFEELMGDGYDFDLIENSTSLQASTKTTLMSAILREFRDTLKAEGIGFAVLVMPSKDNVQNHVLFEQRGIPPEKYFFLEDLVIWLASSQGIPYIDLADYYLRMMKEFFIFDEWYDAHLTEYGTEKAAESIKAHLLKSGLLP